MSEAPEPPSAKSRALLWSLGLLAALLLYVLSIGPVLYMDETGVMPESVVKGFRTFYRPLDLLDDVPVLGEALAAYLAWWDRQAIAASP